MRYWIGRVVLAIAAAILLLTFVNASWLAPKPTGAVKLIAHRGVSQLFDHEGIVHGSCTAGKIEPPVHDYLENTTRSMEAAARLGADMVELDIAPTTDNRIVVFHDWTVDCRTNGKGEVRGKTLAELKALDIGYGYTADGGNSFPFRGQRRDVMPSLEEVLAALPNTPIVFNFKNDDPSEADRLAAALTAARRDVEARGDAFYGPTRAADRIKHYYPKAWAWSLDKGKRCSKDYLLIGWTSIVPKSCRGAMIIVPINDQWLYWGWPNRLIDRMNKVGAKVVVTGPYHRGKHNSGLNLPEQLSQIPTSFRGYIWVDDIWTIGPALRPARDFRTRAQQDAAEAGLTRRRAREE